MIILRGGKGLIARSLAQNCLRRTRGDFNDRKKGTEIETHDSKLRCLSRRRVSRVALSLMETHLRKMRGKLHARMCLVARLEEKSLIES